MQQVYVSGRGHGKTEAARQFKLTVENLTEALNTPLAPWQKQFLSGVMGRWEYTPRDELLNRLNARLRGKEPTLAVNTRYWRNQ